MLRSSNPILSKRDAFTPAAPQYGQQFGQQPYQSYPGQGGGFGGPQDPRANAPQTVQGRMTLDDVITKTAVTIAVLVVTAALAWNFVPDSLYFPAMILSALAPGADWFWSIFNGGSTFASLIANNAGEFDSPQKTGA